MKKLACVLLVLLLSTGIFAYADTISGEDSDEQGLVVNVETTDPEAVVYVEVDWSDLSFSYKAPTKGTWNPKSHQYEGGLPGEWTKYTAQIVVTNHSNVAVDIVAAIEEEAQLYGVNISMENSSFSLEAVDEENGMVDSASIVVILGGEPNMESLGDLTRVVVGNMTVNVTVS